MFIEGAMHKNQVKLDHQLFDTEGTPIKDQTYFRKAIDSYLHSEPQGKIHDPQEYRAIIQMEKFSEQRPEIQTKNKISIDYMREITGNKNMSESRLKLLCQFIE